MEFIVETVSKQTVRQDAWDKCRGRAGYLDELSFPEMLYAYTLRSPIPRGRIRSIRVPPLPPGYYIVDKTDIPGKNLYMFLDRVYPVLAEDMVNFVGEPVLLVVGPDRAGILNISDQIRVDYDEILPVTTWEESEGGTLPLLTGTDNVHGRRGFEQGDVEAAFVSSSRVFADEFRTDYQEHLYLETLRAVAVPEGQRIVIYSPLQVPDAVPAMASLFLGWSADRIRVVCPTTGGAFGGKIETPIFLALHAALAALKTQKPVGIIYNREEDILVSTKRHPSRIRIRSGVNGNNEITAIDMAIDYMGGCYKGSSPVILDEAVRMSTGPYRFENVRVNGRIIATNRLVPGATRGFGVVQIVSAIETHMSRVARSLGLDPLDFRLRHILRKGDRTCTGGRIRDAVKMDEIVATIEAASGYREKRRCWLNQQTVVRKGIGMALYAFGAPHTVKNTYRHKPRVLTLRRDESGDVEILSTIVEIGQGIQTSLREIAARVLEIPLERVSMRNPDTDRDPGTLGTGASLGIVQFGKSVERAALRLKNRWEDEGKIEETEDFVEPAYIEWDEERMNGDAFHTYSWGATAIEIAVDTLTCEVQVTDIWTVHDIGEPINELICLGQVDGGVVQGLSFGLMEYMESKDGFLLQSRLRDYPIATAMDVPSIQRSFVANPYHEGPFGAKSVGEMPIVGGPAALAEAITHALGIEIDQIPITPERILALLKEKEVGS
jgi:CO/xanthine dehydrogenase Mo-binding subunit